MKCQRMTSVNCTTEHRGTLGQETVADPATQKNFMAFLIAALTITQWASKLKWRYVPCFATKNVFVGKAAQCLSI